MRRRKEKMTKRKHCNDDVFIRHIQSHLKPNETVICKICGKSAKDIIENEEE